jgi:hypothetical protein
VVAAFLHRDDRYAEAGDVLTRPVLVPRSRHAQWALGIVGRRIHSQRQDTTAVGSNRDAASTASLTAANQP